MRAWVALALAMWLAVSAGGCRPAELWMSADQASQIAVKAFTSQYTSGQEVTEVKVLTTVIGASGQGGPGGIAGQGPDVWRVNVVGTITDTSGVSYGAGAWIDVDPVTGVAHIVTRA